MYAIFEGTVACLVEYFKYETMGRKPIYENSFHQGRLFADLGNDESHVQVTKGISCNVKQRCYKTLCLQEFQIYVCTIITTNFQITRNRITLNIYNLPPIKFALLLERKRCLMT